MAAHHTTTKRMISDLSHHWCTRLVHHSLLINWWNSSAWSHYQREDSRAGHRSRSQAGTSSSLLALCCSAETWLQVLVFPQASHIRSLHRDVGALQILVLHLSHPHSLQWNLLCGMFGRSYSEPELLPPQSSWAAKETFSKWSGSGLLPSPCSGFGVTASGQVLPLFSGTWATALERIPAPLNPVPSHQWGRNGCWIPPSGRLYEF